MNKFTITLNLQNLIYPTIYCKIWRNDKQMWFLKYHLKESNGIFYSRKLDLINVYPKGS